MRILVVEDQRFAAMYLMAALKSLDHEPELATNGDSALAKLADTAIRIVVSDLNLPGMDGLELCRQLRATRKDPVYFFLATAADLTPEKIDECLAAGVDDFLEKPAKLDQLRVRLRLAERFLRLTA